MKDDEKWFLKQIYDKCRNGFIGKDGLSPRDIINSDECVSRMSYKRCWYLLSKWDKKGWYDYGVSDDLGWLTPKGIEVAKTL
jgi:hypothetical protein